MSRYFNADVFLKSVKQKAYPQSGNVNESERKISLFGIMEILTAMPMEDVSPVVYGEWKHTVTGYPYCSNCDWMPEEDEMLHTDYFCPNCGAKMDGGK